jgi:hypothetical protein
LPQKAVTLAVSLLSSMLTLHQKQLQKRIQKTIMAKLQSNSLHMLTILSVSLLFLTQHQQHRRMALTRLDLSTAHVMLK